MSELTWEDVRAARHDIESLIYTYGEAAEYLAVKKWEDDHPTNTEDDYIPCEGRDEKTVEALRQLLLVIREAMSKHSPEIWAGVLQIEAEEAEAKAKQDAKNLAKAKAEGFDSYEAMQEAETKDRRSASAKKAAATRKERAEMMANFKRRSDPAFLRRQAVIDGLTSETIH